MGAEDLNNKEVSDDKNKLMEVEILLKNWVEISLVHIRSNQLLSEILPEISKIIEKSALNLCTKFTTVVEKEKVYSALVERVKEISSSYNSLHGQFFELHKLAEKLNNTPMADSGQILSDEFSVIKATINDIDQKIKEEYQKIAKSEELKSQNDHFSNMTQEIKSLLQDVNELSSSIQKAVGGIIVDIQFQDKTSQYIENSINVLNFITEHSNELRNWTIEALNHKDGDNVDVELLKQISDNIKLSDIKKTFINNLINHGDIKDGKQISDTHNAPPPIADGSNDELF